VTFTRVDDAGDAQIPNSQQGLISGTITNATAGWWRVTAQVCMYGLQSASGSVFVQAGTFIEKARHDFGPGAQSPRATIDYRHSGGPLTVTAGYHGTGGVPMVVRASQGVTKVTAIYVGG
jgi:hypothetical protein